MKKLYSNLALQFILVSLLMVFSIPTIFAVDKEENEAFANPSIAYSGKVRPTCNTNYSPYSNGTITVYDPTYVAVQFAILENTPYRAGVEFTQWQSSGYFTNLAPGKYRVRARNAQGVEVQLSGSVVLDATCCNNISNGGDIATDQTICGISTPGNKISTQSASGGNGPVTYVWMKTTGDFQTWTPILGANTASYQPELLTETTRFLRCARSKACGSLSIYESSKIFVEVLTTDMIDASITGATNCASADGSITISLTAYTAGFSYEYSIDGGATWSTNPQFNNLPRDKYTIGVRSNKGDGCFITAVMEVLAPSDCNDFPPTTEGDINTTIKNTPVNGNVLTNDTDPENDNYFVNPILITDPTNGSVTINPDGSYTYTPNTGYLGPDVFEYEVCDDGNPVKCASAEVYITVIDLDADPATPISTTTTGVGIPNNNVEGNVLANNYNPGIDLIINTLPTSLPTHGTVTINPDGSYIYTPTPGYAGPDEFSYEVCNTETPASCAISVVQIIIKDLENHPPVVTNDGYISINGNTISGDVTANDTHQGLENISTTTTPISQPAGGTVTINPDGTFVYNPNPGFIGQDQFDYQVCDVSGDCSIATVFIQVTGNPSINQSPVFVPGFEISVGGTSVLGNVYNYSADPNSSNISVATTPMEMPMHGSVTISPNGTYSYTPNPGYEGTDQFTYEICETNNASNCTQGVITMNVLNQTINHAPISIDETHGTVTNASLEGQVLLNDYDVKGSSNLQVVTVAISAPQHGTLNINSNGMYSYLPIQGYTGIDRFVYEVCNDANPAACSRATTYIVVYPEACLELDLKVQLEGAMIDHLNPSNYLTVMRTDLNISRGLLPGQTPKNALVQGTPAGQPYNMTPWNYEGAEGAGWTDVDYESLASLHGAEVVDWMLLSLRTGVEKSSEVAQNAVLLLADGRIVAADENCLLPGTIQGTYYVVLEHRNHLGIMTQFPVTVANRTLSYDFTQNNSYRDLPSPTGYGQKQLPAGNWVMYSGDGQQVFDSPSFDINGSDKVLWLDNNGIFDRYQTADFDLNGDVSGVDRILWNDNNGITSRVPR